MNVATLIGYVLLHILFVVIVVAVIAATIYIAQYEKKR